MKILKQSWETAEQKTDNIHQNLKNYLFGLLTTGFYAWNGWKAAIAFIVFNIIGDYIIMKRQGEEI